SRRSADCAKKRKVPRTFVEGPGDISNFEPEFSWTRREPGVLVSRALFGLRPHARLLSILCGGIVIAWSALTVWPHIGLGQPPTHPEVEMGGGSVRAIVDLASLVHQSDVVLV